MVRGAPRHPQGASEVSLEGRDGQYWGLPHGLARAKQARASYYETDCRPGRALRSGICRRSGRESRDPSGNEPLLIDVGVDGPPTRGIGVPESGIEVPECGS